MSGCEDALPMPSRVCAFKRKYQPTIPTPAADQQPNKFIAVVPTDINGSTKSNSSSSSSSSNSSNCNSSSMTSSSITSPSKVACVPLASHQAADSSSQAAKAESSEKKPEDDGSLETIHTINSNCKKFHFKAQLLSKFSKDWGSGEGCNLNMFWGDKSTPLQLKSVLFNNFSRASPLYADLEKRLVVGKTYTVCHGTVKPSNPTFNKTGHPYELTLSENTVIRDCEGERFYMYKMCPKFDTINQKEKTHNFVGKVVKKGGLPEDLSGKDGRQYVKTTLFLGDTSGHQLSVELWGKEMVDFVQEQLEEGQVVFCYNFAIQQVSRYNSGCLTVTPVQRTGTDCIFRYQNAKRDMCEPALLEYMEELDNMDYRETSFRMLLPDLSLAAGAVDKQSSSNTRTCLIEDVIADRDSASLEISNLLKEWDAIDPLNQWQKADKRPVFNQGLTNAVQSRLPEQLFKFTALVVEALTLSAENPFIYTACTNVQRRCNRKVSEDANKPGFFYCKDCKITTETCRYLYCVNLLVSDETGSIIITCFDDHVVKMLQDTNNKFNSKASGSSEGSNGVPITAQDLLVAELGCFPEDATPEIINVAVGQYLSNELQHKRFRFTIRAKADVHVGRNFTVSNIDCIDCADELRLLNAQTNSMM